MGLLTRSMMPFLLIGGVLGSVGSAAADGPGSLPPIVFSSSRAPGLGEQLSYSIGVDGTGRRQVAHPAESSATSPDGRMVARAGEDAANAFVEVAEAGSNRWTTVAQFPRTDPSVDDSVAQIVWSPRSDRLAITVLLSCKFRGAANCNIYDLWSVYGSGSGLAHVLLHAAKPAWAPDDRRLAFSGYVPHYGGFGVSIGYADGTGIRRLTQGGSPAWSPDGKTVALLRRNRLTLISSAGTNPQTLVPDIQPPAWSPRTGLIAVVTPPAAGGGNALEVFDPKTSLLRGLVSTPKPFSVAFGAWSPNGRRLAYVATADKYTEQRAIYTASQQVYTVPAGGGRPARVTHEPIWTRIDAVRFDASGRRIVYDAYRYDADTNLYAINDDGTALTQLTTNPGDEFDPSWSPDGRIVFQRSNERRAFPAVAPGLFVLDPVTGTERRLTSGSWDTKPAWSPDGTAIAFVRHAAAGTSPYGGAGQLYSIAPDGSGLRQITSDGCAGDSPSWSPDSARIVYTSCGSQGTGLFLIGRDGSDRTQLTDTPFAFQPDWSPDGKHIAFVAPDTDGYGLFTIAPDGTGLQQVPTMSRFAGSPAWSADGAHLLYTTSVAGENAIHEVALDGSDDHVVTSTVGSDDSPHWRRL